MITPLFRMDCIFVFVNNTIIDTPIEYLKGVGTKRAELLRSELDISDFNGLLNYFPFRYVDRSVFLKVIELQANMGYAQLRGEIVRIDESGQKYRKRLTAVFTDGSGYMELTWFKGLKWIRTMLKTGVTYNVYGKPISYRNGLSIAHPELEIATEKSSTSSGKLQPVYHTTEKLSAIWLNSKGIEKLQRNLLDKLKGNLQENLPDDIIDKYRLMSREDAITRIHFPADTRSLQKAQFRLKFEEFFFIQLEILSIKTGREIEAKGYVFKNVGAHFNKFFKHVLPFELTNAQKRVIKEMRVDMKTGSQMNRLLQGDVGSGKTMVALMCMLLAKDNNFQSALMAPTEILAAQHYKNILHLVKDLDIKVAWLTGNIKGAERKEILKSISEGDTDIVIGTHALIQDKVNFNKLGLAIIDEQHRFGVAQRAKLWEKGELLPHVLVMTATPIPRTLAMTLYGDLDVSVIDELPPGRQSIKTVHRYESSRLRVFGFMKEQIAKGRQVYIVYPLIEESQKLDYKNLMSGFEIISDEFPVPDYQLSIVHGKMPPDIKEYEMQRFVRGETDIMVATNVIEVGVDVSNATVMVIESAERFGLSQLHQLRGRIGRGTEQSYCILLTGDKLSPGSIKRMRCMVSTSDGFEIAETDLKLRGAGNLMGTQQSGIPDLKIGDLAKDGQIIQLARNAASDLLKADPHLRMQAHKNTMLHFARLTKGKKDWSRIS